MSHTPSAEFLFEFLYTPPQLDDLQNDGGPFLYRWGWGPPCKTLDKSLPLFTIKRDKQWSYLSRKDPGLNGGYGGVLRKQQIVRADQYVAAEAGLLNAQRGCPRGGVGLAGFGLGEACDVLNERDWSDVAALSAIAN